VLIVKTHVSPYNEFIGIKLRLYFIFFITTKPKKQKLFFLIENNILGNIADS